METPSIDERPVLRKLISDALFKLANDIDIHAVQELISYNRLTAAQDPNDQQRGGQQKNERHMWFSTHGGFGQQVYPYGQALINMAVKDLELNQTDYDEYFRSNMADDGYNIGSYMTRVKEKTAQTRTLAIQLASK